MKIKDITAAIEKIAPLKLAQDWDNVGLLVGDAQRNVKNILLTIDVTSGQVTISLNQATIDPIGVLMGETGYYVEIPNGAFLDMGGNAWAGVNAGGTDWNFTTRQDRLDAWWKYDELASRFGSNEERDRTEEIIHDLRVMVYDPRCLFIKRCTDTEHLIEMWAAERGQGSHKLAFLRALYIVKPLICALPISWGGMGEL